MIHVLTSVLVQIFKYLNDVLYIEDSSYIEREKKR